LYIAGVIPDTIGYLVKLVEVDFMMTDLKGG
jgi:hypothetical protein